MKLFRGEEAFRVLVVALMMASLASAAGELARRLVGGFDPGLLVGLSFLVCLEGIATDRLARRLPEASARLRMHLVEWVVIILLLRLVLSLSAGLGALSADVERWLARPQSLVDGGLAMGGGLILVVWVLAVRMSRCLEALGPEADAPPPKDDSAAYYAWLTRPQAPQQSEGWASLVQLFLGGGVLVLVCSGLARLDVEAALSLRHPATAGIVGNALLYFGLGLILLGQGRYALLRGRWQRQQMPVDGALARRWAVMGVVFAAGVAVAVLLLPVRPSLALFSAAFDAMTVVIYGLMQVVMLLLGLLFYLLSLLTRLLGLGAAAGQESAPPPRLPPPAPPATPGGVGWWQAIQGLLLWAALVAVLGYALARFIRERGELWRALVARGGPVGRLIGALAGLWRWLTQRGQAAQARLRALVRRRLPRAPGLSIGRRGRWLRPRSARERVWLLYLLSVRQAAEAGWPRHQADTPYEYAGRLNPRLPEGGDDLQALTQAFVEARYSPREVAPAALGPLGAAYRRLRRAWKELAQRRTTRDCPRPQGAAPES